MELSRFYHSKDRIMGGSKLGTSPSWMDGSVNERNQDATLLGEMISTDLPKGFTVQRIGNTDAMAISHLPPSDIAEYFRKHPEVAEALMSDSSDKRFTPSSFIEQKGDRFRVGWFTRDAKYEFVQEFSNLADAAADYLLLSLGKGRWTMVNK